MESLPIYNLRFLLSLMIQKSQKRLRRSTKAWKRMTL